MECRHCQEKFENETEFATHRNKHAEIQVRLKRTGGRTYGARYTENDSAKDKPSEPDEAEQPKPQQMTLPLRAKPASTPAAGSTDKTLTERVKGIIARFEPYEDGVEKKLPLPAELQCPDCDFKLRNQKELEEHILSVYCRGANIVQYVLCIDSSKPRGYFVEEKLVPFDERAHPSKFQCRKCGELFESARAMEEHEATHAVLPQVCLHCSKVFGTEYELEDHYEWHDDMEYRQEADKPTAEPQNVDALDQEGMVSDEIIGLGNGIFKRPLPWCVGKKAPGLPEGPRLAGVSWISREDVEMHFASRGRLIRPPTHYYTIPAGMEQEEVDRIISQRDNNSAHVSTFNDGHMNTYNHDKLAEAVPLASSSDSSSNMVKLITHGSPTGLQVRDVAGRIRIMNGSAFATVFMCLSEGSTFADKLDQAVDEAVAWEESGNLSQALMSWKKVLDLLIDPDKANIYRDKPLLVMTKLAMLSSQLNKTDEAISYWCDAIELSEKLFGIHDINNFNFINSIAVIFDERGDFAQAAPLYRRSLAGRLRINGPDHADTLMSTQELGMTNLRLNHLVAARRLLEKACIGYENLRPRDEKMSFGVLQNLASVYGALDMKEEARALLLNGIPRFRAAVGVEDLVLAYALNNYLLNHEGAVLPAIVVETIQALRQSRSEHWWVVAENLASFYCNNRRYREALALYRDAIQRHRQQYLPTSDPGLINNIHAVARCHEVLAEFAEAETAYRDLASLTAPATPIHLFATQSVGIMRRRLERISAERKQWDLPPYSSPLSLAVSRACAVCKKPTNRLCADCQITPLCHHPVSSEPPSSCAEKHKSPAKHYHNLSRSSGSGSSTTTTTTKTAEPNNEAKPAHVDPCVPSLLPSESQTAMLDPNFSAPELTARFRAWFVQDEHLSSLLSFTGKTQPVLASSRALFLARKPTCIATVRLPKSKRRLVSVWFNKACGADARIRWAGTGPAVVARWKDLRDPELPGMMYLYPRFGKKDLDDYYHHGRGGDGIDDIFLERDEDGGGEERECWLVVAPGKETLKKANQERATVFADGKGITDDGVPDKEMLDWLQLVGDEQQQQRGQQGGQHGGKGFELHMALVVMEWEF